MHDEENTEGGRPAQSDGPPAAYCAYCPRPVAAPAPWREQAPSVAFRFPRWQRCGAGWAKNLGMRFP